MGKGVETVVETEKGGESRAVEAGHEHSERAGVRDKRTEQEQEGQRAEG